MASRFAVGWMLGLLALPLAAHQGEDHPAHGVSLAPPPATCATAGYTPVAGCPAPVGTAYPCAGRAHLADGTVIPWSHNPPSSGAHYATWEPRAGEHTEVVPRGRWVHNLEHGHVVLLYNCPGGCPAELAILRRVLEERFEASILLTPDPELPPPRFAAVAWTWVYRTDTPKLGTLLCFVDQRQGHAPENVPLH